MDKVRLYLKSIDFINLFVYGSLNGVVSSKNYIMQHLMI
jgi:hypothetical protein